MRSSATAFFDVRVSHVNSRATKTDQRPQSSKIKKVKKRKYQQRVIDVDMGTFTPLVFGTNGGMGEECQIFLKHLAEKLTKKTGDTYANTITWIRTRLSFEIIKSVHMCVRGTRTPFYKENDFLTDLISTPMYLGFFFKF